MSILHTLKAGIQTHSPEETEAVAAQLVPTLDGEAVLALHGDLGAGKTTFVRGLARACGWEGDVTSPTYNIFSLYRAPQRLIVHMDAYRLESAAAMDALMLEDFLAPPYVLAIEWAGNISEWLPKNTSHLKMTNNTDGSHSIQLLAL